MAFLNKEERNKCWENRDVYWSCLDKSSKEECKSLREQFVNSCPKQWVKHFDRKREYEKYKERLEKEGYQPEFPKKENA